MTYIYLIQVLNCKDVVTIVEVLVKLLQQSRASKGGKYTARFIIYAIYR